MQAQANLFNTWGLQSSIHGKYEDLPEVPPLRRLLSRFPAIFWRSSTNVQSAHTSGQLHGLLSSRPELTQTEKFVCEGIVRVVGVLEHKIERVRNHFLVKQSRELAYRNYGLDPDSSGQFVAPTLANDDWKISKLVVYSVLLLDLILAATEYRSTGLASNMEANSFMGRQSYQFKLSGADARSSTVWFAQKMANFRKTLKGEKTLISKNRWDSAVQKEVEGDSTTFQEQVELLGRTKHVSDQEAHLTATLFSLLYSLLTLGQGTEAQVSLSS